MTDLATKLVSEEEGRERTVYPDNLTFDTIGVGCCVDKRVPGAGLCDAAIDVQLAFDLSRACRQAAAIPGYADCNDVRQAVLVSMCFQLGDLRDWPKFRAAIFAKGYETASAEGLNSAWAQQTPKRAKRQMAMMRSGVWQEHV